MGEYVYTIRREMAGAGRTIRPWTVRPRAEIVARKVIECANLGERNPARLREIILKSLQG
jgi:hypothetical protein